VARRFRALLAVLGVLLLAVLGSTYAYKHGTGLHGVHVGAATLTTVVEAGAAVWLALGVLGDAPARLALGAQLAGVVLALCTVLGAIDVLFAAQLLSSAGFAILLVRAAATVARAAGSEPTG